MLFVRPVMCLSILFIVDHKKEGLRNLGLNIFKVFCSVAVSSFVVYITYFILTAPKKKKRVEKR